jgi:hypothetical protein
MALTSVAAIYATGSLLLQRIYIPSGDDNEINLQHVGAGETLVRMPLSTYQTGGPVGVQAAIGIPSFSGRCAVVDGTTNTVTEHIIADPAIYSDLQGRAVVASDITIIGDFWTGTQFTRAYLELDATTGLVVALSTQPIATAKPSLNALNLLIPASIDPSAVIGSSIPNITAKIVARAMAV